MHKVIKNYICLQCSSSFKTMFKLREHEKNDHGISTSERNKRRNAELKQRKAELKNKRNKNGNKLSACPYCSAQFMRKDLFSHIQGKHKLVSKPVPIIEVTEGDIFAKGRVINGGSFGLGKNRKH